MTRNAVFVGLIVLMGLGAALAAGGLEGVTAQDGAGVEPWTSSREAPAGTPTERFSPPDTPLQSVLPEGPAETVSWRIVGSALKPRENNVDYVTSGSGGCVHVSGGSSFTVWNAPVHLPQGALVETLRMYYHDTSGSNSSGWLTVYDLYGDIVQEWTVNSSGNLGNSFNDSVVINHTIDYSVYSYVLNWRPNVTGSTMQLCGFRVFYTAPMFGAGFVPVIHNENP